MNAKTQELEAELRTLRGKQETLESEVAGLKGIVTQANTKGRLAREELDRARAKVTSMPSAIFVDLAILIGQLTLVLLRQPCFRTLTPMHEGQCSTMSNLVIQPWSLCGTSGPISKRKARFSH